MLSIITSAALYGVEAREVQVEVRSYETDGDKEFSFILVGLPDAAIRESKERVLAATQESGLFGGRLRVLVSLAPADLRKSGSLYDLSIAIGLINNTRLNLNNEYLADKLFVGELGLNGSVRGIHGALAIALLAREMGKRYLILPQENALEAGAVSGISVIGVRSLRETIQFLTCPESIQPTVLDTRNIYADVYAGVPDYLDVKGQEFSKRALTVAAAGNHNLLMIGQPGTGKSMLAKRLPGIMPPLSLEESMEVTKIHSIAGTLDADKGLLVRRPFRDPHHTVSDAGLVGGQSIPRPGEISLAHGGVLFLDELPEFRRTALEVLRQPLENGSVTISRASGSFTFPARFMLIAAMNPCPCGYYGSRTRRCTCSPLQVASYRARISGPLLDRIDMHIEVPPLPNELLTMRRNGETSASMREKVLRAREIQKERYKGTPIRDNAGLSGKYMDDFCPLSTECVENLKFIINELQLSPRSYDRILRVARTLADLDGGIPIQVSHINEAANYRILDRPGNH